jgi:hypothetical protein
MVMGLLMQTAEPARAILYVETIDVVAIVLLQSWGHRGLDNVSAEFSLTALVYNLRRAFNILGVEAMMAAVRRWSRGLTRPILGYNGTLRSR